MWVGWRFDAAPRDTEVKVVGGTGWSMLVGNSGSRVGSLGLCRGCYVSGIWLGTGEWRNSGLFVGTILVTRCGWWTVGTCVWTIDCWWRKVLMMMNGSSSGLGGEIVGSGMLLVVG